MLQHVAVGCTGQVAMLSINAVHTVQHDNGSQKHILGQYLRGANCMLSILLLPPVVIDGLGLTVGTTH